MGTSNGKPVNVAVIGMGKRGHTHYNALENSLNFNVISVCDSSKRHIHGPKRVYDYEKIASFPSDPKLEAVFVSVPYALNEKIVKYFLSRGVAVFCEKPLAPNIVGVCKIKEVMRKHEGSKLCIGYHHMGDKTAQAAKLYIEKNIFENQDSVESIKIIVPCRRENAYYDNSQWFGKRAFNGMDLFDGSTMNQGIHWIQLGLWLAGVCELSGGFSFDDIRAYFYKIRKNCIGLEMDDKANISCQISSERKQIEFVYSGSTVMDKNGTPTITIRSYGGETITVTQNYIEVHSKGEAPILSIGETVESVDIYENFYDCVRHDATPLCSISDAAPATFLVCDALERKNFNVTDINS